MLTSIDINLYPQQKLQNRRHNCFFATFTIVITILTLIPALHLTRALQEKYNSLNKKISTAKQQLHTIALPHNYTQLLTQYKKSQRYFQQQIFTLNMLKKIEVSITPDITFNKINIDKQRWLIEAQTSNANSIEKLSQKLSATIMDIQENKHGQLYQFNLEI